MHVGGEFLVVNDALFSKDLQCHRRGLGADFPQKILITWCVTVAEHPYNRTRAHKEAVSYEMLHPLSTKSLSFLPIIPMGPSLCLMFLLQKLL